MTTRLLIIVPVLNRRRVVEQCLPTLAASKRDCDYLSVWDDGSTEFTTTFLQDCGADEIHRTDVTRGIEKQRRAHFDYAAKQKGWSHLYLTDADALHDPGWRQWALTLQERVGGAPVCLYNTRAHTGLAGNVIEDDPAKDHLWQRVMPGISYLLTREHVDKVLPVLNQMEHWDWFVPSLLGHRCCISRTSYVDHVGWGGLHHGDHPVDGGDRATSPTPWLQAKRLEVVEELSR